MRKRIYISEKNYQQLREALKKKLKDHPNAKNIGSSNQEVYGEFADTIRKELSKILALSKYRNNRVISRIEKPEHEISGYKLWVIFYQTQKHPSKRKRMKRTAIQMLILYAFGELRNDLLVEEEKEKVDTKGTGARENFHDITFTNKLTVNQLKELIRGANHEIKILDTVLDNWGKLKKALQKAVGAGCKVRILVSDPDLLPNQLRSQIITFSQNPEFPRKSLDLIKKEIQSWKNRELVDIETHPHFPGFNLFAIDKVYYVGVFWYGHEALEGPFWQVASPSSLQQKIDEHFEGIWKEAKAGKVEIHAPNQVLPEKLKSFVGNWYMYCNKGEENRESYNLQAMQHGRIVENLVKIKPNGSTLKVTFFSNFNGEFSGSAYLCPSNSDYLEIRITTPSPQNTLHFLLCISPSSKDYLIGLYNYIYHYQPKLGTGLAGMVRIEDDSQSEIDYEAWKPRDIKLVKNTETKKLIRYLTFPTDARIESIEDFDQLKRLGKFSQDFKFKGVYKLYAYKGSDQTTYITESLIKIDEYRRAFHKRSGHQHLKDFGISEGKAEMPQNTDSLVIGLKNKENDRPGYFIFNVDDQKPRKGNYYLGIFGGAALNNNRTAIGSRVIMKFLGTDLNLYDTTSHRRYSLLSQEINDVPDAIRLNLSGRINNMIGFFHNSDARSKKDLKGIAKEEISMNEVFFDSACQRALTNDVNQIWNAAKMFERAVLHGFKPASAFKEKLELYEEEGWLSSKMKEGIINNDVYRNLMDSLK